MKVGNFRELAYVRKMLKNAVNIVILRQTDKNKSAIKCFLIGKNCSKKN